MHRAPSTSKRAVALALLLGALCAGPLRPAGAQPEAPSPPQGASRPAEAVLPLPEAIGGVASAMAALGGPADRYVVGTAQRASLLDEYALHMVAAHLASLDRRVEQLNGMPPDAEAYAADELPAPLLHELRTGGADLYVHVGTAVQSGQRYLVATAYEVATGQLRARASAPCHLREGLELLLAGDRARMDAADRRWLELFEHMFASRSPQAHQPAAALELAEARFFFQAGLWEQAAEALARTGAPAPTRPSMKALMAYQLAGQSGAANEAIEQALKQHFDSGPLWALRAWLSLRQGRVDDAVIYLEQARLSEMAREGLYRHAGALVALERGDEELAEQQFARAAQLLPQTLFVQLQAARLYRNRAELDKAIAYYRRATAARGATADTWGELAVALEAAGDVEGAIEALRSGFRLDSGNLMTTRHLATLLRGRGRHEEALDILSRAAEANPRNSSLLAAYGDMAAGMWRVSTATRAFEESIQANGRFPYGQTRLAAMLALRRRYGEARQLLADLLAVQPEYAPARIVAARILGELAQTQEALASLKEVTRRADHEVEARLALVEVYLEAERPAEAVAPAQIAASSRPDARSFVALSRAFLAAGDPDKAQRAAETALQAAPSSPEAHVALARVLTAQGKPAEALEAADRALGLDPFCVQALEACGEAARAAAEFHRCADFWRRALALNPWDADLHYRLSEVLGPKLGDWTGTEEHLKRYVELEKLRTEAAH